MYKNKIRRRRFRPTNGKMYHHRHNNGAGQRNNNPSLFSNDQVRLNSPRGILNTQRLVEKYNNLAKEALLRGDKTLSENYLQHADHFSRIATINNAQHDKNNDLNPAEKASTKDEALPSKDDIQLEKNQKNKLEERK